MFNFFRRKASPPNPSSPTAADLGRAATLGDAALIGMLRQYVQQQHARASALFLVGYQSWKQGYWLFYSAVTADKNDKHQGSDKYPASLEGYVYFLADAYANCSSDTLEHEVAKRRIFYLYLATLLEIAQSRAKKNPLLWDDIADIWVMLLPGARLLRKVIDETAVWTSDETDYFESVKTEQDGESYCLSALAPVEIRYHNKISAWQEKDLPPDVIASLRQAEKLIRGD